jgi:hypothetical protein
VGEVLAATDQRIDGLAVDDEHVYWLQGGVVWSSKAVVPTIPRERMNVGEPSTKPGQRNDKRLALDDEHLYASGADGIFRLDKAIGSTPEKLADAQETHALAVVHDVLFVGGAGLWKIFPANGYGRPENVFPAGTVVDLEVDGDHVYWSSKGGVNTHGYAGFARLGRVGPSGVEELVDAAQLGPDGIAVNETHLYWAHAGAGFIRRVPKAGGPFEIVAEIPRVEDMLLAPEGIYLGRQLMKYEYQSVYEISYITPAATTVGCLAQLPYGPLGAPRHLVLHGSFVFVATYDSVIRVPRRVLE